MKEKTSEEIIIAIATALLFNEQESLSPQGKIIYAPRTDLLSFNQTSGSAEDE